MGKKSARSRRVQRTARTRKTTAPVVILKRIAYFTFGSAVILLLLNVFSNNALLGISSSSQDISVLGEGEEQKKEEQKKSEEQAKEAEKKTDEQKDEQKNEQSGSSGRSESNAGRGGPSGRSPEVKIKREGNKSETEIETASGQKIKTKVEDNVTTKIEIEEGELKIKFKLENGQLVQKVENEDGEEVELDEDELEELEEEFEDELEEDGIQIATNTGKPTFIRNKFAATTEFPLSIDVGTNQLIVTTPAGQKVVTVLPDIAVQNLIATNVINIVDSGSPATGSGELAGANTIVELRERGGELVYEVKGQKNFKLFAFIPVSAPVTAVVSAETGSLVTTDKPLFTTLIDIFSP